MRAKEFVIEALKELLGKVTTVKVRYEFDANALVHVVEVLPEKVYSSNKEYLGWEEQLYHDFVKQFPRENICFITDDALVGIKNAEFEQQGENYSIICIPTYKYCENGRPCSLLSIDSSISNFQPLNYCNMEKNGQHASFDAVVLPTCSDLLQAA